MEATRATTADTPAKLQEQANMLEQRLGLLQNESDPPNGDKVKDLQTAMRGLGFRLERLMDLNGETRVAYLPKEFEGATVLQQNGAADRWRATKEGLSSLPSAATGIKYRGTKDIKDQINSFRGPQWGEFVSGIDEGDGWVRVQIPSQKSQLVTYASQLEQRLGNLEEAGKPQVAAGLALSYGSGKLMLGYNTYKEASALKGTGSPESTAAYAATLEERLKRLEQAPGITDTLSQLEERGKGIESLANRLVDRIGSLEQGGPEGLETSVAARRVQLVGEAQKLCLRLSAHHEVLTGCQAEKPDGLSLSYASGKLKLAYNTSSTSTSKEAVATQIPVDYSKYVALSEHKAVVKQMGCLQAKLFALQQKIAVGKVEGHIRVAKHEEKMEEMKNMYMRDCEELQLKLQAQVDPQAHATQQRELDSVTEKCRELMQASSGQEADAEIRMQMQSSLQNTVAAHDKLQEELQRARVEQEGLVQQLTTTVKPETHAALQMELQAVTSKMNEAIANHTKLFDEHQALRSQVQTSVPRAEYDAMRLQMEGNQNPQYTSLMDQYSQLKAEHDDLVGNHAIAQSQLKAFSAAQQQSQQGAADRDASHGQQLTELRFQHSASEESAKQLLASVDSLQEQTAAYKDELTAQRATNASLADQNEVLKMEAQKRLASEWELQQQMAEKEKEMAEFATILAQRNQLQKDLEAVNYQNQIEVPARVVLEQQAQPAVQAVATIATNDTRRAEMLNLSGSSRAIVSPTATGFAPSPTATGFAPLTKEGSMQFGQYGVPQPDAVLTNPMERLSGPTVPSTIGTAMRYPSQLGVPSTFGGGLPGVQLAQQMGLVGGPSRFAQGLQQTQGGVMASPMRPTTIARTLNQPTQLAQTSRPYNPRTNF